MQARCLHATYSSVEEIGDPGVEIDLDQDRDGEHRDHQGLRQNLLALEPEQQDERREQRDQRDRPKPIQQPGQRRLAAVREHVPSHRLRHDHGDHDVEHDRKSSDIDDAVQEALLIVARKISALKAAAAFSGWLFTSTPALWRSAPCVVQRSPASRHFRRDLSFGNVLAGRRESHSQHERPQGHRNHKTNRNHVERAQEPA